MNRALTATAQRDPSLAAIAMIYLLGAVFCLLGALAPPSPQTPRLLHGVLAAVGLTSAALLWWVSNRWAGRATTPLLHLALAVNTALTWLLMLNAATPTGRVLIGYNFVYLAMVAAYFLPQRQARVHAAMIVVAVVSVTRLSSPETNWMVGLVVTVSIVTVSEVLGRLATRLRTGATTDSLTGVLNRAAFTDVARDVLAAATRRGQQASLVVADLDDFKLINDEHGHTAGDEVLTLVASQWRGCLRAGDVLARLGGDEFVVLLPGANRVQAEAVVARMRTASSAQWSSGIATAAPGADLRSLFDEADRELYAKKAKRERRVNQRVAAVAPVRRPPGVVPAGAPRGTA
jgi:diguanylate cyclase (GGDEF)-like protein